MASSLIANATGNLTASGTWGLCDSAAELDTEANSTSSTTSYVASSAFVAGALTVDGIAVKISSKTSGGTFTVDLFNSTGSLDIDSVTVNVADLPASGWAFFKFGSSHLLLAATNYQIRIKSSSTGTVTLFRDATAGNWTRELRTTTAQAPIAGDHMLILGELTGAGTSNSLTVTMNQTAGTIYGATTFVESIAIGSKGTLTYGTSASTAYRLVLAGIIKVVSGGTLNMGTSGTPVPSTSTATMEFSVAVNVDSGLVIAAGATVNMYGASKTTVQTLLTVDKAAAATTLTVVATSGWVANDVLAIASTSQTATNCENKTILTVDSGTGVTLTAGLTNAHSGTSPTQAEVANLTRNVSIFGSSISLQGYINCSGTDAVVNIQYVEFYQLGSNTSSKRGIDVAVTTGTFNIQYSSIHGFESASSRGINISSASGSNITVSNNVFYRMASVGIQLASTSGITTITNNLLILNLANSTFMPLADSGSVITGNIVAGSQGNAIDLTESNTAINSFDSNTIHSSGSRPGLTVSGPIGGTISNCIIYRVQQGIVLGTAFDLIFLNCTVFGCAQESVNTANSGEGNIIFDNFISNGDTTFACPTGLNITNPILFYLYNCNFSTVSGIKTAHTNDIVFAAGSYGNIYGNKTTLGAGTPVSINASASVASCVQVQNLNASSGNHKVWQFYGILVPDTVIYNTASPSLKMTPNSASNKLQSAPLREGMKVAVANGNSVSIAVYIRKSVVGDGTAYNGNQPRLIVRRNDAAGYTSDTVLATYSSSGGSWNQLSATTSTVSDDAVLEFIVDCDGTTGWVNIDDWTVS